MSDPKLDALIAESAQRLLKLDENWDEEGASSFDQTTIDRVTEVLNTCYQSEPSVLPALQEVVIGPMNDGSIDMFWKKPEHSILLNVQPGGKAMTFCAISGERMLMGKMPIGDYALLRRLLKY